MTVAHIQDSISFVKQIIGSDETHILARVHGFFGNSRRAVDKSVTATQDAHGRPPVGLFYSTAPAVLRLERATIETFPLLEMPKFHRRQLFFFSSC